MWFMEQGSIYLKAQEPFVKADDFKAEYRDVLKDCWSCIEK